jgi:hypothetical protein
MKLLPIRRRWLLALAAMAVAYLMLAYVLLPFLWTHHEHEPSLASLPRLHAPAPEFREMHLTSDSLA